MTKRMVRLVISDKKTNYIVFFILLNYYRLKIVFFIHLFFFTLNLVFDYHTKKKVNLLRRKFVNVCVFLILSHQAE